MAELEAVAAFDAQPGLCSSLEVGEHLDDGAGLDLGDELQVAVRPEQGRHPKRRAHIVASESTRAPTASRTVAGSDSPEPSANAARRSG